MGDDMGNHVNVVVNGQPARIRAGRGTLLRALREELRLTGAKEGCGQGDCGTCIVLVDGDAVNSCLVLADELEGRSITTVEGLATPNGDHPLQRAFRERWAFQCGYCTPGMLLSAAGLLLSNPRPSVDDIREAISGNLCRCTNYRAIVEAVMLACVTEAAASDAEPVGNR